MITDYIPWGRENAIKRKDLLAACGLSDRDMRRDIEAARKNGVFIINMCDGRGYWQTNDLNEVFEWHEQEKARAIKIMANKKPARDALKAAGYPVTK